jgi:anthranilate phosphoribosyltransferase
MLLLSGAGYRVLIHGTAGHTPGRLYTEHAFRELGLPVAADWAAVSNALDEQGLAYLPLQCFLPALQEIIALKPVLGLRSPVNTLTRMMNPLGAPASLQSIFHPAYARIHQEADRLLGQPAAMVFKGDSGEVEIKPHADSRLQLLRGEQAREILLKRSRSGRVEPVDAPATLPLRKLWRGEQADTYGLEATLATTTAALLLLRPGSTLPQARGQAGRLWRERDRDRLA